jgi:multidrug transporter EmrE-like cation transporter
MNWLWFSVLGVLAYVALSLTGQLTGGYGVSALDTALRLFRPYAFAALIVGNTLWVVASYFGFKETKTAIPTLVAVGVITSFAYSVAFLESEVTLQKIGGLLLVLAGICLLA